MAGDLSIMSNAGPNRVHRIASLIFVHPDYNPNTMENDIAIIRVNSPFQGVDGVLQHEPLSLQVPPTGTVCQLAGWGATSEGSQDASPNLMRVNLEIVDTDRCNRSYQGLIKENMFCAGTMRGGRDACQGDSGGGLMCNGAITGIVSFGFGCGRPRFPGVYIDVSRYQVFIESTIGFAGSQDEVATPRNPNGGDDGGGASSLGRVSVAVLVAAALASYVAV